MAAHDHDHHAHDHHDHGPGHSHAGHDHGDAHHGHDHGHGHHGHSHAPKDFGAAFAIGVVLNAALRRRGGRLRPAHRLAGAAGRRRPQPERRAGPAARVAGQRAGQNAAASSRFTYGLRGTSILAALANATLLTLVTGGIAWEAVARLTHPAATEGGVVMAVAAVGIVVNLATALLFMSGRKDDLNVRAAFTHMAGDAAIAAGVVVAGFAMQRTGWLVAGSRRQPRDRVDRAGGDVGPAEGFAGAVAAGRAARSRCAGRRPLAVGAARRGRGARPAHLGDEH